MHHAFLISYETSCDISHTVDKATYAYYARSGLRVLTKLCLWGQESAKAVTLLVEREVTPGEQRQVTILLRELRAAATLWPGFISGRSSTRSTPRSS